MADFLLELLEKTVDAVSSSAVMAFIFSLVPAEFAVFLFVSFGVLLLCGAIGIAIELL